MLPFFNLSDEGEKPQTTKFSQVPRQDVILVYGCKYNAKKRLLAFENLFCPQIKNLAFVESRKIVLADCSNSHQSYFIPSIAIHTNSRTSLLGWCKHINHLASVYKKKRLFLDETKPKRSELEQVKEIETYLFATHQQIFPKILL